MRVNLVPESARHLEMTRARQMRVDTRDLAEARVCGWSDIRETRNALPSVPTVPAVPTLLTVPTYQLCQLCHLCHLCQLCQQCVNSANCTNCANSFSMSHFKHCFKKGSPTPTTRWRNLHWLQIWPPDGAMCIGCKIGHQMALLALVLRLATRWGYLHWL